MADSADLEAAKKARLFARNARKSAITRFAKGTLGFDQLLALADQEKFKSLRKIKILKLLSVEQGWSTESIKRLLINNGFSEHVNVGDAKRRKKLHALCQYVINNSAPDNTQLEEVKGWPWRGSILKAIEELPGGVNLNELEVARGRKAPAGRPKKVQVEESVIENIVDDIEDSGATGIDVPDDLPDMNDGELDANQLYEMLGVDRG